MKMIITADWHLRASRPRCRIDDWYLAQKNAVEQVKHIAIAKNADVYIVGDIFNSNSDTSFQCIQIVQDFAKELWEYHLNCCILAGNHDLLYHSSENIDKSAIGILFNSDNIFSIKDYFKDNSEIKVSASNFDEKDDVNADVVFKHTLCFPDVKSLPPNVDAITAKELLSMFKNAEYIFTGDYHHNFHYCKNDRHVVNPGCLIRQVSDMKDYQCGVYFVDTDDGIIEFVPIIDNVEFVDDDYIVKQNEREERIESFVDKLKDTKNVSLNFVDNVNKSILSNDLDSDVIEMIKELMEI